tara:strand:- start:145 stop:987 length:843 start_codon:yes stop_codon:yes gene_type:complete
MKNKTNPISIVSIIAVVAISFTPYSVSAKQPEKIFVNSIGIKFLLIPAGKFIMGSNSNDEDSKSHELPQHEVTLTKSFYLSETEVTQSQWEKVMGADSWKQNSAYGDDGPYGEGPNYPVYYVSFNDVLKFLEKMKALESSRTYRLPSEAEWEYAARAGTTTRYYFGDEPSKLDDYAWFIQNSKKTTNPVAQKEPNAWGLYDMYGNVWEWVNDVDAEGVDGYPAGPRIDPVGAKEGESRRKRGGSWWKTPDYLRSAARGGQHPDSREDDLGFRLLLELPSQ